MSRGFHLWHSQPLDRAMPPWLANPCPPAMSPHVSGTRHLSHWVTRGNNKRWGGRDGGKRMIQRLNEESGYQKNAVLSTWRWCKQGWPRLSQMTDCWSRACSLLLTELNILFNFMKNVLLWLPHLCKLAADIPSSTEWPVPVADQLEIQNNIPNGRNQSIMIWQDHYK